MRSEASALGVKNSYFKNWIKQWTWFILSIIFIWVITVFAANWYDSLTSNPWDPLTSTKWNNLAKATVPTGAVMAFYWISCPDWWTMADGSGDEKKVDWTLWNLDLRWEFIRWLDNWRLVDSGRVLGSSQNASRMMWHRNANFSEFLSTSDMQCLESWLGDNLCPSNPAYKRNIEDFQSWNWTTNWATSWTSVVSTSTIMSAAIRPRNVALLYCVKQ